MTMQLFTQLFLLKIKPNKHNHYISGRWHCDMGLLWLKDWLETTSVEVTSADQIECFTPRSLHGRALHSIRDTDFVPTTSTEATTHLRTFPPAPQPTSSSLVKGQGSGSQGHGVTPYMTGPSPGERDFTFEDSRSATSPPWLEEEELSGFNPDDFEGDNEEDLIEFLGNNKFTSNEESVIDNAGRHAGTESIPLTTLHPSKHRHGNHNNNNGRHGNKDRIKYKTDDIDIETIYISTLPNIHDISTKRPNSQLASNAPSNGKDFKKYGPKSLAVIIATTVSTILFIAVLITAIVFACKRQKKKEVYHNAIKYQQKNDVLYFMPNGHAHEGSNGETITSTTSREKMQLVPGRDINHEGPLRMYKWEDF